MKQLLKKWFVKTGLFSVALTAVLGAMFNESDIKSIFDFQGLGLIGSFLVGLLLGSIGVTFYLAMKNK